MMYTRYNTRCFDILTRALITAMSIVVVSASSVSAQPQTVLFPGVTGNALIDSLRVHFKPTTVKDYNVARDSMFMSFNYVDGAVECFYTGDTVRVQKASARVQAQNRSFNTEHIWPQSKFIGRGNPYSDLHHLRPARADVNASRNNYRFKAINTSDVTRFWRGRVNQSAVPSGDLGTWSKTQEGTTFDNSFFEPRDQVKGDVARAMFYFYTMYEEEALATDRDYFKTQMLDLRGFHAADPVDPTEYQRTLKIATIQSGKANPFILDTTLVRRAFFTNYTGPSLPPAQEGTFSAEYTFSGTASCNDEDVEATRQNQGLTLSSFIRVGVNCNVVSNAFNSNGWPSEFSNGHYVGMSAEALPNYSIGFSNKDTLKTFIRRSNTGPAQYRVFLVTDGSTQTIAQGTLTVVGSNVELKIPMPSVSDVGAFEIRLHAWGATNTAGTFRVSTFRLNGKVINKTMGTGLDDPSVELPRGIRLYPAYPNPFNPTTTVTFQLENSEIIELSLHDILGRPIQSLAKGTFPGGLHSVPVHGVQLSSGVYFVRLSSRFATLSHKITLIK